MVVLTFGILTIWDCY